MGGVVRTGLVAVGAAIAIVGAGSILAVVLPFDGPDEQQVSTKEADGLAPQAPWSTDFTTVSSSQALVTFTWYASGNAEVRWWSAAPCQNSEGYCVQGGPLQSWNGSLEGRWTTSGAPSTLYCVWVNDNDTVPLNFSGHFQESYRTSIVPLGELGMALTLTGGSMLVGIGAIAVYLGLFLPGGTFGGGEPELGPGDDPEFDIPEGPREPR